MSQTNQQKLTVVASEQPKKRKQYSPQEKVSILRRHLADQVLAYPSVN